MAKYIDLDLAIDEIQKNKCGDLDYDSGIDVALAELKTMPAADVALVIRCKDCRWWDTSDGYSFWYCMAAKHSYFSTHWEIHIHRTYKGDFYCADAERKIE